MLCSKIEDHQRKTSPDLTDIFQILLQNHVSIKEWMQQTMKDLLILARSSKSVFLFHTF